MAKQAMVTADADDSLMGRIQKVSAAGKKAVTEAVEKQPIDLDKMVVAESQHRKQKVAEWQAEYDAKAVKHEKLALTWVPTGRVDNRYKPKARIYEIFVEKCFMGTPGGPYYNKWEVRIGTDYWSRDNNKMFKNKVNAMHKAELLLAERLAKTLGRIQKKQAELEELAAAEQQAS